MNFPAFTLTSLGFSEFSYSSRFTVFTAIPSKNERIAKDDATQTLYYGNNIIDADRAYTYDALYRLIEAQGREHINQPGTEYNDFPSGINLPHPNDPQAMRRYSRSYEYDNSGNMTEKAMGVKKPWGSGRHNYINPPLSHL